jgi:hypothetical protein
MSSTSAQFIMTRARRGRFKPKRLVRKHFGSKRHLLLAD